MIKGISGLLNIRNVNQKKDSGRLVGIAVRNSSNVYILENEEQLCISMIDESWMWYRRMGHNIMKVSKKEALRDLPNIVKPLNLVCKHCQHGKQSKAGFKAKEHTTSHPLEIVHTDLCAPIRDKILQGEYVVHRLLYKDDLGYISQRKIRLF